MEKIDIRMHAIYDNVLHEGGWSVGRSIQSNFVYFEVTQKRNLFNDKEPASGVQYV